MRNSSPIAGCLVKVNILSNVISVNRPYNPYRLFSLLLLLFLTTSLWGQGPLRSGKCGVWSKPGPPPTGDSTLYVDRFGNLYSEDELSIYNNSFEAITASNCDNTGIFNPLYEGSWTMSYYWTFIRKGHFWG
jgi:hypothetical protein